MLTATEPTSSFGLGGDGIGDRTAEPAIGSRRTVAVVGFLLPFGLVVFLSLKGGGYDAVLRGQVGVVIWWVVLTGAIVGALPVAHVSRVGWSLLGLLLVFCVWTGAAVLWSESSERTIGELGRVAAYAGVFTLTLAAQGRDAVRRTVHAVGAAIAVVGTLALLSRLEPDWFPVNDTARYLPEVSNRLNYPLNYWNGLAALIAVGTPLLLSIATSSRHVIARALAAGVIPALALTAFYTLSRGGAFELALAVSVLIALYPRRLKLLVTLAVAGIGSTLAIAAGVQRHALADGLSTSAADRQADEMLVLILVICVGVGLLQAALALGQQREIAPRASMSIRGASLVAASVVVAALGAALALGAPGYLSDRWEEFKRPVEPANNATVERFESASGNGRYQYWQSAIDAAETDPLMGIGPGTYEYWWAREGTLPGFVADAHSLFVESLAEVGVPGVLLIGGFILAVIACGTVRCLRAPPEGRAVLAAATAGCCAFGAAAAIDWVWEIPVLPVAFLLLAASMTAPVMRRGREAVDPSQSPKRRVSARVLLAIVGVLGVLAVGLPLLGSSAVRASQDQVNAGDLQAAYEDAAEALSVQPYSATASIQQALVLELGGNLDAAVEAASDATRNEPTNWRTWLVLSRLEARRGNVHTSIAAYRRARDLNPRSPLFR